MKCLRCKKFCLTCQKVGVEVNDSTDTSKILSSIQHITVMLIYITLTLNMVEYCKM